VFLFGIKTGSRLQPAHCYNGKRYILRGEDMTGVAMGGTGDDTLGVHQNGKLSKNYKIGSIPVI
jgi:hypothetical protein